MATQPTQEQIDKTTLDALDSFLGSVRKAAVTTLSRSTLRTPMERSVGIRHILDNITLALAVNVHDADPLHPELTLIEHPHRKFGGDNIDALFLGSRLSASQSYRLYGKRGSVKNVSFVVQNKGEGFAGSIVGQLTSEELVVDNDNNFELFLGGQPRDENWVPLAEDADRLIVRQYFADWENEQPMELRIERLGEPVPAPEIDAQELLNNIVSAGELIENEATFWADLLDKFRPAPNTFIDFFAKAGGKINAAPGGRALVGYWNIPQDSALIIRVRPPQCSYWNLELYQGWWESSDYRYRLSGTNMHYGQLEENGELIAVFAHDDPGVINWCDTSGFTEGLFTVRWMQSDEAPIPECVLVKRAELDNSLPPDVTRLSPKLRIEQIAERRRGIYNRFHFM
jgi:hypothetical protein